MTIQPRDRRHLRLVASPTQLSNIVVIHHAKIVKVRYCLREDRFQGRFTHDRRRHSIKLAAGVPHVLRMTSVL
jgi:hypothetical protein